ncbi:MAG: hypothetical protein U0892_11205 [Pirellulales bacterium]
MRDHSLRHSGPPFRFAIVLAACCLVPLLASTADAVQSGSDKIRTAADLLPASTVSYAEFADSASIERLDLLQSIASNDTVLEIWRSPDVMKARGGLVLVELTLGTKVIKVLRDVTAQGASVAIDGKTQGAILLARAVDAATLEGHFKRILKTARDDARSKGNPDAIKEGDYRGIKAYQADKAAVALLGEWLLVTNKPDLGKEIIDRYLDGPSNSLSDVESYAAERKAIDAMSAEERESLLMWSWSDTRSIRKLAGGEKLFQRPVDNFAAELLLGGMLAVARENPVLTMRLSAREKGLKLVTAWPGAKAEGLKDYAYFFGPDAAGRAPSLIAVDNALVNVTAFRDIADLWRHAGDLFDQQTNDRLAQVDTTLTTLFSGKDFGEDILGGIAPQMQLIVLRQDYAEDDPAAPSIKLPSAALAVRLRDAKVTAPELKRIFQSLIGFINVTGAMNQQPQFDLESFKREDGAAVVSAQYVIEADRPKDREVPIQFNFSPTLILLGDHAVLAGTRKAAEDVIEAIKQSSSSSADQQPAFNTRLSIQAEPIARMLHANMRQLISQNMVEKGHSREEAEKELGLLFKLFDLFDRLQIEMQSAPHPQIEAELQLKP